MKSIYESWQKSANILYNNRFPEFNVDESKNLYPPSRQPLVMFARQSQKSPAVNKLLANVDWILQQSFYFYLHEIIGAETKIICNANGKILCDNYSVQFDEEIKKISTTIVIDESFHNMAALDAMTQLLNKTRTKPMEFSDSSIVEELLNNCYRELHPRYRNDLELIINCILENTITKDLDLFLHHEDEDNLHPFFLDVIKQHFHDEARHSIFAHMLYDQFWLRLDPEIKGNLRPIVLFFVDKYLEHCLTSNYEFTELLLDHLQISSPTRDEALLFCHNFSGNNQDIMKQTIMKLLDNFES